jgi:hypothetical protein
MNAHAENCMRLDTRWQANLYTALGETTGKFVTCQLELIVVSLSKAGNYGMRDTHNLPDTLILTVFNTT